MQYRYQNTVQSLEPHTSAHTPVLTSDTRRPLFVLHVALQGCLRGGEVAYGVTADTGGHIRYLLDLVAACARDPGVERIAIVTRLFRGPLGRAYAVPQERVGDKVEIVRLASASPDYLPKERLAGQVGSLAEALVAWIERQPRRPDAIPPTRLP